MDNITSSNGSLRELALFAGGGGGILGGKLLGWKTVCAVEWEPYAASILAMRQNDGILSPFPIWDDVQTFDGRPWRGRVDVVSGGFPCQDISVAGKGAGIDGERSSMWSHMARIIDEVRPQYAFVENSPMLVGRGLTRVLSDLAKIGYDARWTILGAHHVGAPHKRDRIWIVAQRRDIFSHSSHNGHGRGEQQQEGSQEEASSMADSDRYPDTGEVRGVMGEKEQIEISHRTEDLTSGDSTGANQHQQTGRQGETIAGHDGEEGNVSRSNIQRAQIQTQRKQPTEQQPRSFSEERSLVRWWDTDPATNVCHAKSRRRRELRDGLLPEGRRCSEDAQHPRKRRIPPRRIPHLSHSRNNRDEQRKRKLRKSKQATLRGCYLRRREEIYEGWEWRATLPFVGRVVNGVANRVDRLKALGNGQVPLVAATAWEILTNELYNE